MSRFSLCVSVCCAALSFTSVSTCACLYVPRRVPRVFPLVPVYVCRAEFRECFHLYLSMCAVQSSASVSTCTCLYVPLRVPRVFPPVPVYVCRSEFRECFHLYLSICAAQSSASVSTCTCLYVPCRVPRVFPPVRAPAPGALGGPAGHHHEVSAALTDLHWTAPLS